MMFPSISRLAIALGFLIGIPMNDARAWEPVRAHPQDPYIVEFRGKPTLLRTFGATYEWVFDSTLDFIPYLDVLKRDGMNLTRVWCLGYPAYFPERFIQPWPRSTTAGNSLDGLGKFDFSAWNEDYFVRLKAFAQAASDRGIVVEFTFFSVFYEESTSPPNAWDWRKSPFHPSNNVQGYGPNNKSDTMRPVDANLFAVQQAAVRRIVNELNGFDNVYYEIQNEPFWNEPGIKDDQEVAFHAAILGAIRDEEAGLPNRHLVAHNFPQNLTTMSSDFDVINEHYPAAAPNTPILGAEALLRDQYFRGRILSLDETNNLGSTDAGTARQTRLEAWMFFIGGGGIYNGLDVYNHVYSSSFPSGDNALGNSMRRAVRNIGTYMDQTHLVALRRNLAWVTGGIPTGASLQASASVDQQYLAYLHHGQSGLESFQLHYDPISTSNHNVSLRVTLEAGSWRAVWTNPEDLAQLHVQEFTHAGGEITLEQVTYQADVALRIDRTGPGDITPPPPPSGLSAVANADGSITLSWEASLAYDLDAYRVYRSETPDVPTEATHRVRVVSPAETSYTDQPTVPDTTYYYIVTAVDDESNELASTYEVSAFAALGDPNFSLFVNEVGQYALQWTSGFAGWVLQESPDHSPGSWIKSSLTPTVEGSVYQVVITPSDEPRFFRLIFQEPVASEPVPRLRISAGEGGQLVLEWPTAPVGWYLQESPDLAPGTWVESTRNPVVVDDQYQVVFMPTDPRRFFRLTNVPPPPLPQLQVLQNIVGQVQLQWPDTPDKWQLQESPDLTPGSWTDSELTPEVVGGQCQISVSCSEGCRFFRLRSP